MTHRFHAEKILEQIKHLYNCGYIPDCIEVSQDVWTYLAKDYKDIFDTDNAELFGLNVKIVSGHSKLFIPVKQKIEFGV